MSYLQRLKATDLEKQAIKVLPKLPKAPFGSKGSNQSVRFSENEAHSALPTNPIEAKKSELLVTVWTPAGNPMQVQAKDAEHAAFLLKMNPKPAHPIEDQ